MRNHDEKIKDIGRSVLPSTRRKSARDNRRMIHHRQRAVERAGLVAYRRDSDPESVTPDLRGTLRSDISVMMWDRRAGDKVGPLIRWAKATIAADPELRSAPLDVQVGYFARLMPDNTIGRHAVQHIRWALLASERRDRFLASRPTVPGPHVAGMQGQVRQILEAGLHASLNAALRRLAERQATPPGGRRLPPRLLLGSHDVEAFTASMARWPAVRDLVTVLAATGLPPEDLRRPPSGPGQQLPRQRPLGQASGRPAR